MSFFRILILAAVAAVAAAAARECMNQPCNPCTPKISNNTVIEPVPGLRATVEIIADYGTCPVTYRGYQWQVKWGDGVESFKNISSIAPEQAQHTYFNPGKYTVQVGYCAVPFFCCESCTYLSKTIEVLN
eukprot:m.3912 g.3912  ORF g.3912 m.3912 type:complete len:130 (+) comp2146_c0_seq1:2400-2789(+)